MDAPAALPGGELRVRPRHSQRTQTDSASQTAYRAMAARHICAADTQLARPIREIWERERMPELPAQLLSARRCRICGPRRATASPYHISPLFTGGTRRAHQSPRAPQPPNLTTQAPPSQHSQSVLFCWFSCRHQSLTTQTTHPPATSTPPPATIPLPPSTAARDYLSPQHTPSPILTTHTASLATLLTHFSLRSFAASHSSPFQQLASQPPATPPPATISLPPSTAARDYLSPQDTLPSILTTHTASLATLLTHFSLRSFAASHSPPFQQLTSQPLPHHPQPPSRPPPSQQHTTSFLHEW